jgi:hypothetical protein
MQAAIPPAIAEELTLEPAERAVSQGLREWKVRRSCDPLIFRLTSLR